MNIANLLRQDLAQTIRESGYSHFNAELYAKVNDPESGIQLVPGAKKIESKFYVDNGLKLPQKHGQHNESPMYPRATIRMPVEQYASLQEQMVKQGIDTFNLMVVRAIETALQVWGN